MRKLLLLVGALLAAHLAFLFVRPSGAATPPTGPGLDVGVVFDVGGRGDKSFNDGAYLGATRAAERLGARVRFIEPGEGSDREAGLRLLAAEGMDLVVGVGFIFTDAAAKLPDPPQYLGKKNGPVRQAVENILKAVEQGKYDAASGWTAAVDEAKKAAGGAS